MTTTRTLLLGLVILGPLPALGAPEATTDSDNTTLSPRFGLEMSAGLLGRRNDAYRQRLNAFGFGGGDVINILGPYSGVTNLAASARITRVLDLALQLSFLESVTLERETNPVSDAESVREVFGWDTTAISVALRPTWRGREGPVAFYLQLGVGVGWASSSFNRRNGATDEGTTHQRFWGLVGDAGAGMRVMPWSWLGFGLHIGYVRAPIIDNLLGETHDSGGWNVTLGLRSGF